MSNLIQYVAPPVLGAFIGYLTNYVAIKMLFRPLKQWRIFGIRVPMTPGVIPSKRHMLAENIGVMVGRHLLTAHDVGQAINGEIFQHKLKNMIDARLRLLMQQDLGPIKTIIPSRFKNYFEATVDVVRLRAIKLMQQYLDSEEFSAALAPFIAAQLDAFLNKEAGRVLPADREELYSFLETTLAGFLANPALEQWASEIIREKLSEFIADERPLADLIPSEIRLFLLNKLEEETPYLLEKLGGLLEEPIMRDKIAGTICNAVDNFSASLGPLAAMLGSFINRDTIYAKVSGFLDEKSEDVAAWLLDDAVQERISRIIRAKAEEILARPCSSLLARLGPAHLDEIDAALNSQIRHILTNPDTAFSIAGIMRQALEGQRARPLNDILVDLIGPQAVVNGKEKTVTEIIAVIRSPQVKKMLENVVVNTVEKKLLAKPIGPLTAIFPSGVRKSFADYLLQQLSTLLIREIPGLVDSLNIEQIVTRKVDSLDLLRLEGLLMSIMEEQFKYINIFGALLGFLIGLLNLIVLSF